MGHEDDGFGAMIHGVFDGGECADNTLIIRDVAFLVERDIEVYLEISDLSAVFRAWF